MHTASCLYTLHTHGLGVAPGSGCLVLTAARLVLATRHRFRHHQQLRLERIGRYSVADFLQKL